MLNVATPDWGTTVHCDSPTERYFSASRLVSDHTNSYCDHGMICPPMVRPPVNVLFFLSYPFDLRAIIIKPYIGRHRVTYLKVFLFGDMPCEENSEVALKKIFHNWKALRPLVSINLDGYPARSIITVRLNSEEVIPADSCSHSAECLYEVDIPFCTKQHKKRFILLQLCKTDATCVPCLGAVELWCAGLSKTSDSACTERANYINQTLSTKPTPSIVADDASVVAPGQFLDFLTGDLMQEPVKLPSGNYVDRSNLIQFWRQRQVNDPNSEPVDPFTMVPLDETKLVCDAQFRSSIEIYRHLWERLDRFCSTLDRADPVSSPIRTLPLHESSSDEETVEDGSDILRRYPHLMVSK